MSCPWLRDKMLLSSGYRGSLSREGLRTCFHGEGGWGGKLSTLFPNCFDFCHSVCPCLGAGVVFHPRPADRPQGKRASCVSFLHSKPGSQQAAGLCLAAPTPSRPPRKEGAGTQARQVLGCVRGGVPGGWLPEGASLSREEPQAATWAGLRRPLRPALPVPAGRQPCGLPGHRGAAGVSPSVARRRSAQNTVGSGQDPSLARSSASESTALRPRPRRDASSPWGPAGCTRSPRSRLAARAAARVPWRQGPPRRRSLEGSGDSALCPGSPPQRSQKLWTESAYAEPPVAACIGHTPRSEGFLGVVAAAFPAQGPRRTGLGLGPSRVPRRPAGDFRQRKGKGPTET